jgi:hypothetical protein
VIVKSFAITRTGIQRGYFVIKDLLILPGLF